MIQQNGFTNQWSSSSQRPILHAGPLRPHSGGCEVRVQLDILGNGEPSVPHIGQNQGEAEPIWTYPMRIIGSPRNALLNSTQRTTLTPASRPALHQMMHPLSPQLGLKADSPIDHDAGEKRVRLMQELLKGIWKEMNFSAATAQVNQEEGKAEADESMEESEKDLQTKTVETGGVDLADNVGCSPEMQIPAEVPHSEILGTGEKEMVDNAIFCRTC
ncbi:hypothetical protein R1flu_027985 [Riccia fluitans]|uniref:Uncharacterized protein n=1 Tax=Riccia fluitans TaxID=41844 RepID=A0ABD1XKD7_9MARC